MSKYSHSEGSYQLNHTRRHALKFAVGTTAGLTLGTTPASTQEVDSDIVGLENGEPTVLIGNKNGVVYAVETTTGEQQWEADIDLGPNNVYAPTAANGTLFIGHNTAGSDPSYYAINTESGSVEWEFDPAEDARMTPPTISDGTVYIGTDSSADSSGKLYALNEATGDVEWQYTEANRIRVAPTVVDNTVYIGAKQGTVEFGVTAIDASSGETKWRYTDAGGSIRGAPTVYKDKVYVPRGGIKAVDRSTGELVWEFTEPFNVIAAPAVVDDTVYIGSRNFDPDSGTLYALDSRTGDEEWSYETSGKIETSATVANDGTVIVVTEDGIAHAIDSQTGEANWEYSELDFESEANTPTIYNGKLYVTDTRLHAIEIESGEADWIFDREIDFPDDIRSPTVVDNLSEGTSEDSRVRQGILGHNDYWATRATVDTAITFNNVGSSAWEVTSIDSESASAPLNENNPQLLLSVNKRYLIENKGWSAHPFELRDTGGDALLSQKSGTTGSFESDGDVAWMKIGDKIKFTLTEALNTEIDSYVCTVHTNAMAGDISNPVDLRNVTLDNNTVSDDGSSHSLSFDVFNLSPDDDPDEFTIQMPENVDIDSIDSIEASNNIDIIEQPSASNPLKFEVDPASPIEDPVTITVDLTLSGNSE